MMRNQPNPSYLNTNNNHQLISRQQTFVLDRKLVTIHSNDRDVNKWPFSNHFEVQLPEAINNQAHPGTKPRLGFKLTTGQGAVAHELALHVSQLQVEFSQFW